MKLLQLVPAAIGGFRRLPQIFRDQLVLGLEVTVKRHLIGAGGLGNGLDPNRPDSMAVEQVAGGRENSLPGRNSLVFVVAYRQMRGHRRLSLDTGVTGQ